MSVKFPPGPYKGRTLVVGYPLAYTRSVADPLTVEHGIEPIGSITALKMALVPTGS